MAAVWYKRTVSLNANGLRTILHIDACDFKTEVWLNGRSCGVHFGGSSPISLDITDKVIDGDNVITICAEDDTRSFCQPLGKQSFQYASKGCRYTRTTGIWQSVWIEQVPMAYITNLKLTPNASAGELVCEIECVGAHGMTLTAETSFEGRPTGSASAEVLYNSTRFTVKLTEKQLWNIGDGKLYDLKLTLGDDVVESYFGLRDLWFDGRALHINGKIVYQRLVLDQGFYPDGIWTAPSDAELLADVERSMAMGFNGARLHQKVFEPRFLYHCDRLGYIVWGEHGNWGLNISRPEAWQGFLPEWLEVVSRDFNHPAIIGWCPLNETQLDQNPEFVRFLAAMTRAADPTRLYIDASGWRHVDSVSDIIDLHCYEQDPDKFAAYLAPTAEGQAIEMVRHEPGYRNCPTFVSEYGGIRWASAEDKGWGYGRAPEDEAEFLDRYAKLAKVILDNPRMGGLRYTQLTDVEQEVNGLYTYDRRLKFDAATLRAAMTAPAACEQA
ncbi:MAG: beta-galactosidase [Clostridia bacterium]|nr:beta-galactosidase [Clostridia bacterium]